jgi:hypothetical protein
MDKNFLDSWQDPGQRVNDLFKLISQATEGVYSMILHVGGNVGRVKAI